MSPADLKAGVTVLVPAGVDSARRLPYGLHITEVQFVASNGKIALVVGDVRRANGTPYRRLHQSRLVALQLAKLEVLPANPSKEGAR